MIQSFTHKGLKAFFEHGSLQGIAARHARKLRIILDFLDSAQAVGDMDFPGSGLHPLKGERKTFWSVKVSGNWRVIFRFEDGDAFDVNYVDYH